MPAIIRLIRPLQWLKNGFVFAPLIFAKHLFDTDYTLKAFLAFVAFSLTSSTIYVVNDIFDREADALHPVKKNRPIASGEISVLMAIAIALSLLSAAFIVTQFLPIEFLYIILIYVFIQLFYSYSLKHVVILDLFIIATGFMLRMIGGAYAIQVVISHWIVITTLFVSLFLAASKRRAELVMIQKQQIQTRRRVLQEYSVQFLDAMLIVTTTGMAISYSLYTMAEKTIAIFHSEYLIFTTVFVLFGIFRYLFLVMIKNEGENPTAILAKDAPTAINIFLWLISCIGIIYFS